MVITRNDVTTGQDGTVTLRVAPGTYRVTELSVPAPYFLPDKGRRSGPDDLSECRG